MLGYLYKCVHIGSIIITSDFFQTKEMIHEKVMDCMLHCMTNLDNRQILSLKFKKKKNSFIGIFCHFQQVHIYSISTKFSETNLRDLNYISVLS